MAKAGFAPISFDAYVDLHMRSNPKDMARAEVVSALRSALTAHNNVRHVIVGIRYGSLAQRLLAMLVSRV